MISDTLSEAGDEIRRYLDEMPEVYAGEMRAKIERLLIDMDAIRSELDTPPGLPGPTKRVAYEIRTMTPEEAEAAGFVFSPVNLHVFRKTFIPSTREGE